MAPAPSDSRASTSTGAAGGGSASLEVVPGLMTNQERNAATSHFDSVSAAISDVLPATDSAAWPTDRAPSCPTPGVGQPAPKLPESSRLLAPGELIDDFEIIRVLGAGAFGVVYLARQLSLDRQVALKVAANRGSEGRTMARLEHRHIVQVFSETVDPTGEQRLLCMQLVPGASLQDVYEDLSRLRWSLGQWRGVDYLASVDNRAKLADTLDHSALRDRERLAESDDLETVAWVGARLADALDFAHQNGVLHRDIKPANVLVDRYGRPFLADFNIAYRGFDENISAEDSFGGTLAYMAPEHVDAFHPEHAAQAADIDGRADLYSLAIVLFELLEGRPPFRFPLSGTERMQYISELAEIRRAVEPPLTEGLTGPRKALQQVLAQALAPTPAERFPAGQQFAEALDGCGELRQAERRLPKEGWLTHRASLRPFVWLVILTLAPQFIGSAVNITYNTLEIVTRLTPEQQSLFMRVVGYYNLIVYPLAVAAGYYIMAPVYRDLRRVESAVRMTSAEAAAARKRALRVPVWLLIFAALGWLPGGILFPTALHFWAGPLQSASVFYHFLASFTLSGLIAAAYSFLGIEHLVLRVIYPRLWANPAGFQRTAREELCCTPWRLTLIQVLAGSIPLLSAVVILMVSPQSEGPGFRLLLGALIVLGWVGFEIARTATRRLSHSWHALSGDD